MNNAQEAEIRSNIIMAVQIYIYIVRVMLVGSDIYKVTYFVV